MIKLVKVKSSFYDLCKQNAVNEELLFNEKGRPCVLLVKLKYKNTLRQFVVPMRSNISPSTPSSQYFPLPPNPKTKPNHRHGLHYTKLFPIVSEYVTPYYVDKSKYHLTILNILNKNEKKIVQECQSYLFDCENGKRHFTTPNIDGILSVLDNLTNSNIN